MVVLAERDKEEMEMDISKLEFDFMGTSVICRSGSPLILADLKKVHRLICATCLFTCPATTYRESVSCGEFSLSLSLSHV